MAHKQTINYKGVDFDVEFDYQPYEPDVFYLSNGDPGYPGCPEYVELSDISYKGVDFWDILEDKLDEIEEIILKTISDG